MQDKQGAKLNDSDVEIFDFTGAMDDDDDWRTTEKGAHFPLKDGETVKESCEEHFEEIESAEKIAEKIKNVAKELKAGKYNPKRYKGAVTKMNNLENWEREFVYSKIDSDLSDYEKEIGVTFRRLYNKQLKRDYLYSIEYDKNGKHNVTRFDIDDNIY